MKLVFIIAAVILITATLIPVRAQIAAPPLVVRNGDIITNPDGWEIPDTAKLKVESSRRKFSKFKSGKKNLKVHVTRYDTEDIELSKVNFDGSIDAKRKFFVFNLWAYDVNKRVFCYRLLVGNIPLPGEAGVGVVWYMTYYDLDGDGKFESWDKDGVEMRYTPKIPEWIK